MVLKPYRGRVPMPYMYMSLHRRSNKFAAVKLCYFFNVQLKINLVVSAFTDVLYKLIFINCRPPL